MSPATKWIMGIIGSAIAVVLSVAGVVLLCILSPLVGMILGWIVGWFFDDTFVAVTGHRAWQVGVVGGFIGGLVRVTFNITTKGS